MSCSYDNSSKFHYLHISHADPIGKHASVMSNIPDAAQADSFTPPIPIVSWRRVHLRAEWTISNIENGTIDLTLLSSRRTNDVLLNLNEEKRIKPVL